MSPMLIEKQSGAAAGANGMGATEMLARVAFFFVLMAALLFGCAGRLDVPVLWAYLLTWTALMLVGVRKMDAGLRQERLPPGPGGKDRNFRFVAGPFVFAHLIVACLDLGRFHWSDPLPPLVQMLSFVGAFAGMALSFWAMSANRFFSPVVRLQSERGHHVITEGPYRYMRHPGYAGLMLGMLCGPLALGSWWALLPSLIALLLILRRMAVEDRFLHAELEGYADYARTTRYRLVPGVW